MHAAVGRVVSCVSAALVLISCVGFERADAPPSTVAPADTPTASGQTGTRIPVEAFTVLAADAAGDPARPGRITRDQDELDAAWEAFHVATHPPPMPPLAAVLVVTVVSSTCRSTGDVLGVEVRDAQAVVVLDPDGEFARPCPGPSGVPRASAYAVAVPAEATTQLTGATVRIQDGEGSPHTSQGPAAHDDWVNSHFVLPTWDSPSLGEPGEAAELRGLLRVADRCAWVVSDRTTVAVLWPREYVGSNDPPALLDADGDIVARDGEQIIGSGGFHELDIGRCGMSERSVFRLNSVLLLGEHDQP